jgi:hypothetical protein
MVDNTSTAERGPSVGDAVLVRGRFASADRMQEAIERLLVSGFDRADLSVPNSPLPSATVAPDSGARPADTEDDARQVRTLHTSGAAAVAALAAAGIMIGTGGAAAPAVAVAVLAGSAAGGAAFAVSSAANDSEQEHRDVDAAHGMLFLSVRVPVAGKRSEAESVLRAAGATGIEVVRHASA